MTPESFPKAFAAAFAAQDSDGLLNLLSEDAEVVSLTGAIAESREEAREVLEQEFSGTFARAKLVSGKMRLRPIGPGAAIIHQHFVVLGAIDDAGQDLPRFGALLTAVLLARTDGWQAVSLSFSALSK